MSVPTKIQNRTEEMVQALKVCPHMKLRTRDDFIEILKLARDGSNGLPADEKLQACAENIFNLCYLIILDKLEAPPPVGFWPSLFRLIERRTWQFVIIILGAFVLFGYKPQLLDGLQKILGR